MILKIERYDPSINDTSYFQEYELPITESDHYTVMDGLKYVFDHIDPSLSFFSHSVCNHGICGRCLMMINGKPRLACTELLASDVVEIAPKKGKVIKDLVVR